MRAGRERAQQRVGLEPRIFQARSLTVREPSAREANQLPVAVEVEARAERDVSANLAGQGQLGVHVGAARRDVRACNAQLLA